MVRARMDEMTGERDALMLELRQQHELGRTAAVSQNQTELKAAAATEEKEALAAKNAKLLIAQKRQSELMAKMHAEVETLKRERQERAGLSESSALVLNADCSLQTALVDGHARLKEMSSEATDRRANAALEGEQALARDAKARELAMAEALRATEPTVELRSGSAEGE
jgi:hypothetical protein